MKNRVNAKSVYIWNLLGNISAASVSVIYLLIVTRLSSSEVADDFSLSYSIGNLWVIIGLFQIRNFQGTDVNHRYNFNQYFLARMITSVLMFLTLIPYLLINGYEWLSDSFHIAIFIILYRLSDVFSDLCQGQFQKYERLDIAGKYMTYRYIISVGSLYMCLLLSKSLLLSFIVVSFFNFIFFILFDLRTSLFFEPLNIFSLFKISTANYALKILKECFPLFINGFLINIIFNEPKLAIERGMRLGVLPEGMQRNYNILFMPVFFMSLIILVIRPLITQMAILWSEKKYHSFNKIFRKIILLLFVVGLFISIAAYIIGVDVLSLVFAVNLSSERLSLGILVLSGVLYSFGVIIENILTIFRRQHILPIVFIILLVLSKLLTDRFIYTGGILGASICFCILMFTYALCSWILYMLVRKKYKNKGDEYVKNV
ncbi:lipopolysaccharide biosynthesis protein [Streptococcus marmotae]|uniref:lipopolysaccharide biosynthesis protein n=1 Tax=Streptococcus marmotae TaxID=1825069 RepID=UPI000832E4D7|nr:polysaccharide biosynthesis protein [Streptococcus marmotae]